MIARRKRRRTPPIPRKPANSVHLAVSIVASDPAEALDKARDLPSEVTLAEFRLDWMSRVDVPRLARETPIPAIFTCRPPWEGGHFQGSEQERLEILHQALQTSHWVDVELETWEKYPHLRKKEARVILSKHDFQGMLRDWPGWEKRMRRLGARVAKLVGMAHDVQDILPPLAWLHQAQGPAIAIAMGEAGVATRLLAPRFARAFLTFASLDQASAPGQISVTDWVQRYGFRQTLTATSLFVVFTPPPIPWDKIQALRQKRIALYPQERAWVLPIPASPTPELRQALQLAGATEISL